jgi:hypothetical protein
MEFIDERVSLGEALAFAVRRFFPLLGASILAGLLIVLGTFMCFVPGIIFTIWYIFVAQVVVVEKVGGMEALNRSKALGENFRWRVFGIWVLIIAIGIALNAGLAGLQVVLPNFESVPVGDSGLFLAQREVLNVRNYLINTALSELVDILARTLQAVCFTLMYFDLRIRKEGFDLELAARAEQPKTP